MKKTIAEQLSGITSSLIFWRKAFDSKENKIIYVRKLKYQTISRSDVWEVKGADYLLYSVTGTIPLYVTIVK